MAGGYDGSIRIDTQISQTGLNAGLASIENKIKGLAATIGIVFSAKELLSFGTNAITAASDLAEAQNVVDTAFADMSYKMEQFADTALETYGISELTAKNMGSTYMAMAKGMGVATDAASNMAVTLTGRLSDVMSFYNKTQTEVDTIGRAIITGETEPIKAIGVVMTQTNLSAYAMAQGFEKAYEEMSASEQLIVRYKYFLEQTALAQGDFAETSEEWANQTRLLNERITEFMTNFGQVLVSVFTPAIQFANEAVTFLNDLFFGDNAEDASAAQGAAAIADEVADIGAEADKSQKKLNGLLSGFDELHIISGSKSEDSTANGVSVNTSEMLGVSLETDTSTAKKAAKKYRNILNEIYVAFKAHPLTKLIGDIARSFGEFFGIIKENNDISAGGIVTTLMSLLSAILAYYGISGAITTIKTFSSVFGGMLQLIAIHPVAAVATGIAALAVGILKLDEELKKQEIASRFGDISISFEEINELCSPITNDINTLAEAFAENKDKISAAKQDYDDLSAAIESVFDAIEAGATVDSSISEQIDDWIDAALGYNEALLDNSAMRQLAASDGVITAEEQAVLDSYDDLGMSIAGKVEAIRAEIHEITQAAADENRALMESELKNIQDLYDQIAQMTTAQGDIKTAATWERLISKAYTYDSYNVLLDEIEKAREQSQASAADIELAAYESMMSKLSLMESNGASTAEIAAAKAEQTAMITDSLKKKQIESLLYEKELLDAFGQASYGDIKAEVLDKALAEYSTDHEREKFKQYYDLFESAKASGATKEQMDEIAQLMRVLGDEAYYYALEELSESIGGNYGAWGTEYEDVINKLADLGWESADSYAVEFAACIEDADTLDGTKLLSDVTAFSKLGASSGQAYINAIMEYIEKSMSGEWGLDTSLGNNFFADTYNSGYYGRNSQYRNELSYGTQPSTTLSSQTIKTETTTTINLLVDNKPLQQFSFVGPVNNAEILLRSNGTGG